VLIFDFFSGTGSATQAFADSGHKIIKVELGSKFEADERDILKLTADYLITNYGKPDFIWASPPCQKFSVASCSRYWHPNGTPRDGQAAEALALVQHTINLIEQLNPTYGFLIENPRGMLRKQKLMEKLERRTVTYCQYGDTRMKPTDLWGTVLNWKPLTPCKNGMTCHESAPRGSRTGTQGIKGDEDRSRVPYALGKEILEAMLN
jgi:hypothetical protein